MRESKGKWPFMLSFVKLHRRDRGNKAISIASKARNQANLTSFELGFFTDAVIIGGNPKLLYKMKYILSLPKPQTC